ncbi:MAG: arylsulfatase [Gemmataceae bacterium]|nr:arylsulfatase [Gemmataceae bacterium]
MNRTCLAALALVLVPTFASVAAAADAAKPPNIVFILADDLGTFELGCYGQKKIKTPNIDRLAADGIRFTNFYAGNAVCAPSRCVLMTGKHPGHAFIRTNVSVKPEGQQPIPADSITIAKLLKAKGYATGATGKWGLGPVGSTGDPNKQGFDLFFGYNCQGHAHSYYPTYLWRNDKQVMIEGNDGKTGKTYSHDLIEAEALTFLKDNKDKPFFLFVPFTVPHMAMQVPEDSLKEYLGKWDDPPYKGGKGYVPHDTPRAAYAAMVTRMDRSVGRIMEQLKKLGLDDNTIVMFSSDNGPGDNYGGIDSIFFESAGPFRGYKGSLYEGGIRVPFIARWPGHIKPGTSDTPLMFCDILPTLCALTGAPIPRDIDGLSFLPTLLGKGEQMKHDYLYWEFPSYGGWQAVRLGNWKGVRKNLQKELTPLELYNLADDPGEKTDLASRHPDLVKKIAKIMADNHTPSELFPIKSLDK